MRRETSESKVEKTWKNHSENPDEKKNSYDREPEKAMLNDKHYIKQWQARSKQQYRGIADQRDPKIMENAKM